MSNRDEGNHIIAGICMAGAALSVALAAFGSHILREQPPSGKFEVFEKAGYYLLIHSVAVLLLSQLKNTPNPRNLKIGYVLLLAGTWIFSVSLYLSALSSLDNLRYLKPAGKFAPFGGMLIIAAWLFLSLSFLIKRKNEKPDTAPSR